MSDDDVLFGFRLRLFSLAGEIGVRAACRAMGVHHSTYYRWKRKVDRWGLEALRVRERRPPRMPNELGPHLEQRILAFSLAHPGFGPKRISAELARERWGGLRISPNGIWRCLRRHGLNTRARRLSLVAGYAARYERMPQSQSPSATSRPRIPVRSSVSTASTSGASQGRRARSGSTRRSTCTRATPGPSCTPRRATHAPSTARRSSSASPRSSRAPAGACRPSSPTMARSFARAPSRARSAGSASPSGASGRSSADQRQRRAPAADDPRGVLAAVLCALTGAAADRPCP